MNPRVERLAALASSALDIYSDRTREALASDHVPRYACVTTEGSSESSYGDNPDVTVHETKDDLAEYIAGTLEEGWPPREVIDLETGEQVGYTVKVTIDDPEEQ